MVFKLPMSVSESGDTVFGIALRFFDFFAELTDLLAQRDEEVAQVLLAGLGEGLRFLLEDLSCQRLELVSQGLLGGFQKSQFFGHGVALLAQLGFESADAGRLQAFILDFGLQVGAQTVALGGELGGILFALSGEGLKSGTSGRDGLRLGELTPEPGDVG